MDSVNSATVSRSHVLIQRGACWVAGCLVILFPMAVYSQQPLPQSKHPQSSQTTFQRNLTTQTSQKDSSAASDSSKPITLRRDLPRTDRATPSPVPSFSVWKMLGVLMLAIAGIFGAAKLLKFWGPFQTVNPLPNSVFDVLGHTTIPPRHTLYLVRIGQRVVLLGASNDNLTNLTEICDEQEIASITHLCRVRGESELEEDSMFTRLLKQVKPLGSEKKSETAEQSNAREELEARLKSFAHS